MAERFMVFSGSYFYAGGGAVDYLDSFNTLEAAEQYIKAGKDDYITGWVHIFDQENVRTKGVAGFFRGGFPA